MTPLVSISHIELDITKITLKLIAGTSPKFNIVTTDYKYGKMHADLKHLVIDSQMPCGIHPPHHRASPLLPSLVGFFCLFASLFGLDAFLKKASFLYFDLFFCLLGCFIPL